MKIAVLTYTTPHRKTYDTLCLLNAKGYRDIAVYAHPFTYTKKHKSLVSHRPDMRYLVPSIQDTCKMLGYSYQMFESFEEIDGEDVYLIGGSGLIPQEFVHNHRIVNSHPGWIPLARGLDALKWAILEDAPIGVTTHFIGEEVDAGEIIDRRELHIVEGEQFYELGMRVYLNEIDMLVGSLKKLDEKHMYVSGGSTQIHRRMPIELEQEMISKYNSLYS